MQRTALRCELARQREAQAERLRLGDGLGTVGPGLGRSVCDEVVEGRRRLAGMT